MNSPKPVQSEIPVDTGLVCGQLREILRTTHIFAAPSEGNIPFLNAVKLESTGTHLIAVATDRFAMGVHAVEYVGDPFTAVIPLDQVKIILQLLGKQKETDWIPLEISLTKHSRPRLRVAFYETIYTSPLFDAEFPKWKHLLASNDQQELTSTFSVNPRYLAKIAQIYRREHDPQWYQRGRNKPLMVTMGSFIGLIMPMRSNDGDTWTLPEWARDG